MDSERANIADVFVGHIGGDDFIAILPDIDIVPLCQTIIDYFDVRVREFYTEKDRKLGYILAKNRHEMFTRRAMREIISDEIKDNLAGIRVHNVNSINFIKIL